MSLTSTDIRAALLKAYAPPGWRVFFEVSSGTGADAKRRIDAIALGIWPSTGFEVIGIEIKVSRSDWQRELKDPAKAQDLMRYCTRWALACPDGLVKPEELPATWGMFGVKEDGSHRMKVKPALLQPEPLTSTFMMAVLRSASAVDPELVNRLVTERVAEREASIDKAIERAAEQRMRDIGERQRKAIAIEEKIRTITGTSVIEWHFDPEALAAAYLLLKSTGLHRIETWGGELPHLLNQLDAARKTVSSLIDSPLFAELREQIKASSVKEAAE